MKISKYTITEYEIRCEECEKPDSIRSDDGFWEEGDTGAKFFKRYGWKQYKGRTLCKDCYDKRNK